MGLWIKFFTDKTNEYGTDELIKNKKASWSKGKFENIKHCRISVFDSLIDIEIPNTEWHQFDKFIAVLGEGTYKSVRTHMVLQAKIKSEHIGKFISINYYTGDICDAFECKLTNEAIPSSTCIQIEESHCNKWFTGIIDKEGPYVSISDKGSILNG
jgi:hypothetical protein